MKTRTVKYVNLSDIKLDGDDYNALTESINLTFGDADFSLFSVQKILNADPFLSSKGKKNFKALGMDTLVNFEG